MLWDSPPPSALVQLPVVLETLALGVSPGRPLPEAVLIPRWHLRHTWDSHLGPCRSPRPSPFKPHFPAWAPWAAADRRPAVGWVTPHAGRVQWPSTADSLALLPAIQVWGAHGRQPGLSAPASRKDPSQLHKPGQPAAGLGDRPRGSSEPWPPAGPAQGWEWVRPKVALRGVEREGARNNHLTAL